MPHSFNKLWIHAIWATKNRMPLVQTSIEKQVHKYLKDELVEQGCPVRIVNGMPDHIHCLFLLNPKKSINEVIKQIKGSSSYYINQNDLISDKFGWETGYAAYSVSESTVGKVYQYIKNQKRHHRKNSFQEEYDKFLELNGFEERDA